MIINLMQLEAERTDKKLTKAKLMIDAEITRDALNNMLNGNTNCQITTLGNVCFALGLDLILSVRPANNSGQQPDSRS